jgi:hypothetical protein
MKREDICIIASFPPYMDHRHLIALHPLVRELRFNSIMPIGNETKTHLLQRLIAESQRKPLWVDLKTRQLRVDQYAYLPYAYVTLNHRIKVSLPTQIYFKDSVCQIVEIVNGNKLILNNRPEKNLVGKGQPVNIIDPSLRIERFFSQQDEQYARAFKRLNNHRYMLSFTEKKSDIRDIFRLDPEAEVYAKIESKRGLTFITRVFGHLSGKVNLMAARDDLYINMGHRKYDIIRALECIIDADPQAIVASRLFASLDPEINKTGEHSLSDLADFELLLRMGYRRFMLSDGVCFSEEWFLRTMDTINMIFN